MTKDTKPEQIVQARREIYQLIFKCRKKQNNIEHLISNKNSREFWSDKFQVLKIIDYHPANLSFKIDREIIEAFKTSMK